MQNGLSREEIRALLLEELRLLKSEGVEELSLPSAENLCAASDDPEPNHRASDRGADQPGTDFLSNGGDPIGSAPTVMAREASAVAAETSDGQSDETAARSGIAKNSNVQRQGDWDIPEIELPNGSKSDQWNYLRDRVLNCPVCNAHLRPGKKVVFGVGNLDADIFLCGEAPGAEEELQGEPFVGRAGRLLTRIIEAMGLSRREVYIGNIMNWRPEMPTEYGNRPPTQTEMECCLPYLRAQIRIVRPKLIVALGLTAVNGLLGFDASRRMGELRGQWFEFAGRPLMITYHPSYLLRNQSNSAKRMVWEDFLKAMEFLQMPISEKQRAFFL